LSDTNVFVSRQLDPNWITVPSLILIIREKFQHTQACIHNKHVLRKKYQKEIL